MKASFVGRTERNHTAFIRIRTATDDLLVLPVEVEVSPHPGIYSPLEMLDFGLLRSQDVSRVLNLNLLNSGAHSIHIVVGFALFVYSVASRNVPCRTSAWFPLIRPSRLTFALSCFSRASFNRFQSPESHSTVNKKSACFDLVLIRLVVTASKVLNAKFCSGKILVQTGTSRYKFSIAYQASVLQG